MASKCRQNYHEESEASINKQINIELNAHYQYLALVSCQKSLCFLFCEVEN
jgi:ferritin heavy chain